MTARHRTTSECAILGSMQLGLPFADEPTHPELYFVRNRRARRYVLRVDVDGRVRVTIPRGGSRREADAFVGRNREWLSRQRRQLIGAAPRVGDEAAGRARAEAELPPRLFALAGRFGLSVSKVSIRNQRSRWGSCGRDGHICLNWRLVLMPDWVRDYVLVHELMHLTRMDHSPSYWKLVARACPEYLDARRWLRAHGRSLQ
jgi:predicted metal-dependent hydrolase